MKNRYKVLGLVIAILLIVGIALPTGQSQAAVGFHISGRNLLDANGNNFIMRGISHAHTWYPTQTSSFANIKAAGANTVRVVLSGGRWAANSASDVANVISLCKTNRLICVLEDHDTTGYGEDGAAYSLSQAVSYWTSIQSVLTGQEDYIIINIGNEPYGNNNAVNWIADTQNAIVAMRNAGFDHTLMVDAPNWGQDWQFYMRDNASAIFNSDPDRNTILSIHMYGVFDTASEVQSYVSTFANSGLPLVIGEFGNNHSDGDPDEDAIMSQAQAQGVGYIGWSWSGNGGGVEYLDMVYNFDPNQLSSWGDRIINGANGLKQTAQECSVYGNTPPTSTPVTVVPPTSTPVTVVPPTTTPPPGGVYQAEDAALGGGVSVDTNHTGYYGTGFVNFPSSGGYVEYQNVNGGTGGSRILRFRHALGASSSRTGQLTVNGASQNITFSPTGSWDSWSILEVTVNLNALANNTIRLQSTGQDLANQDQMEVVGGATPPTATPVTVVPPTSTPVTVVPPTSTPVTVVPPTSTPVTVVPGSCAVNYVIQNDWGSGATINVTIQNNGGSTINGWTLTWTFPGNQQIVNLWNGSYNQSGASVSVSDAGWNAAIGANGGTSGFGFNLSYSGTNAEPTSFSLNGTTCQTQ